jgi:hypothetical protein
VASLVLYYRDKSQRSLGETISSVDSKEEDSTSIRKWKSLIRGWANCPQNMVENQVEILPNMWYFPT